MKLRDFGLLIDQNIQHDVTSFLRSVGFNVRDVSEEGWHGEDDAVLLQRAVTENRLVVTHDADFAGLVVLGGQPVVGIVYLRPGHIDSQFTIDSLQTVLSADPDVFPPFVLVAKRSGSAVNIRIRTLVP